MTIYVQQEELNHIPLTNDLGRDLDQYEFAVIGAWAVVADEAVDSGDEGSFDIREGIAIQSDDLVAGENTFATEGQEVFFSEADEAFSDTETAGYYLVGYLTEIKDSNGVIVFEKLRHAVLITT